jgi:hypothetical protein
VLKKDGGCIIATLVGILIIIMVIMVAPWPMRPTQWYNPKESLPHLAAPEEVPGSEVSATIVGNLSLGV